MSNFDNFNNSKFVFSPQFLIFLKLLFVLKYTVRSSDVIILAVPKTLYALSDNKLLNFNSSIGI